MGFFFQLLLGVALQFIGYLIMPKQGQDDKPEIEDLEDPVAEAGMPVPVVFGTVVVKGLNTLWFGDKRLEMRPVSSGGKK